MIVDCQECESSISDTASACPRCGAGKEAFLGSRLACGECGGALFAAHRSCPSCGAPRALRIQTPAATKDDVGGSTRAASPKVPPPIVAASAAPALRLRRLKPLQSALHASLWIYVAANVALLVMVAGGFYYLLDSIQGRPVTQFGENVLELTKQWSLPTTAGWMLAFAISAFLYCRFVYRALKNLRAMNAPGIETTPAMGVLWSFIPIGNLYAPFMVMTELWRVARGRAGLEKRVPLAFWVWWLLWLVSGATKLLAIGIDTLLSQRETFDAALIPQLAQANVVSLLAAVASTFAFIGLSRGVAAAHDTALAAWAVKRDDAPR